MSLTEAPPTEHAVDTPSVDDPPRQGPSAVERFFGTGDHKAIGRTFVVGSLLMLAIDLVVVAVANFDISSGGDLLSDDIGLRLWANLPISLILCGLLPLMLGLALYVVPLQIGATTVAFPRAAALSLWAWALGTVIYGASWAFDGAYGGTRGDLPQLGNVAVGLLACALGVGALSLAVTVLGLRAGGMTLGRVPFFSFASLVAATLWILTLPSLVANVALGHIQNPDPGQLLGEIHPAIEWFFRQPTVYIAAIPVLGIMLDAVSSSTRSRAMFYGVLQAMVAEFGLLSFGAWAQGAGASETFVGVVFALAVALPVIGIMGGGADMIRRGSLAMSPALVAALTAGLLLLLATLSGALIGIDTIGDGQLIGFRTGSFLADGGGPGLATAQLMFVVGAVVVAAVAAVAAWRRPLGLGRLAMATPAALLAVVGALVMGVAPLIVGLADPDSSAVEVLSGISGAGALLVALAAMLILVDAAGGMVRGESAGSDDEGDGGGTLEFLAADADAVGSLEIAGPYPLFDRDEDGDA